MISVILTEEDVQVVDQFAAEHGCTRSEALHQAVVMLTNSHLGDQYEFAWRADPAVDWSAVTADGLDHPPESCG